MRTPSKDVEKPTLSREVLEDENIFFHEHVHRGKTLPKWLRHIKRQIRYMQTEAPESSRDNLLAEAKAFRETGQDGKSASAAKWVVKPDRYRGKATHGEDRALNELKDTLDDCLRVKTRAIDLRGRREQEAKWVDLLREEFFRTYGEVYGNDNKYRNTFARWELHADILWTECQPKDRGGVRTGPKPDLTYSFPILDPESEMAKWYRYDVNFQNFTIPVLNKLRNRSTGSVISSPKSTLKRWTPKNSDNLGAADLTCFPWAIVEVKTSPWNGNKKEFCHCQAANASAEALFMRERLAEWVEEPCKDALVIFSFTCVGPSVRLWLTYRQENGRVAMRCIWATSLELTWGVFALRTVITNVREWVFQRVKPAIVGWISAARRTTEPGFPTTASQATTSASHELKHSVPEGLDMSSPTSRKSVKVATISSGHMNAVKDQVHSKGSATMEDEESTDEGYNSGHKHQSSPLQQYTHGINCPCPQLACWLSDDEEEDDEEDDDDEEDEDEDDDEDDEEEDEDEDDEDNEEDDEDLYELLGSLSLSGGRWRR